jgi:hypothetical protein
VESIRFSVPDLLISPWMPMPLKPFHQIIGQTPQPQFLLKDHIGNEYGVVEHYETDRAKATNHVLLEFYSPDPTRKNRALIWLDLDKWNILEGHGKNLPDEDFESGLNVYLQGFSEAERDVRRDRARRARFSTIINLAEEGYTIAYQEMFPGELAREDFPSITISGRRFIVDDQYGIRPGDYRNQVTMVFVPERTSDAPSKSEKTNDETALLCNWLFGEGYEIVHTSLPEDHGHTAIRVLVENKELEKIYRERLLKMRREGTLLGVKPKPYAPSILNDSTPFNSPPQ